MQKNKWVAAVLNFFLFGAGYVYLGHKQGMGWALTVGAVVIRYGEISIFLSDQQREKWYALMIGLFFLQVALAMDAYKFAESQSSQA